MKYQLKDQGAFRRLDINEDRQPGWSARKIKIGRFVLEDVLVHTREGSHDLNDTLRMANDKTRRVRGAQSRYSEPLPPSSAPRRNLRR